MMRQRTSGRAASRPWVWVASASLVELRSTIRPSTGFSGALKIAVGLRPVVSWGAACAVHGNDASTARTIAAMVVFMYNLPAYGTVHPQRAAPRPHHTAPHNPLSQTPPS